MTAVSWAVQAHPSRARLAEALVARIGSPVDVIYDPEPASPIRAPWRSYRRLLDETPAWATHRFQIQDDAIVCQHFREAIERAVGARPDRLLVFFTPGDSYPLSNAVLDACARDEAWAPFRGFQYVPCVALCWPVGLIEPFTSWVDEQRWRPSFVSDDEMIGRYMNHIGHVPLGSVPSLVEHPDVEPSLVGKKTSGGLNPSRVAACFIGADCGSCALEIDWG